MNILGITANGRGGAAAALVMEGELVATFREERLTLQGHDPNFPSLAIERCLRAGNLRPADVGFVSVSEVPEVRLSRALAATLQGFPFSRSEFTRSMRNAAMRDFWIRGRISREIGIDPSKITFCPQQVSLAANAFLSSSFDDAAVLTIDMAGEWLGGAIFAADRRARVPLRPVHAIPYPHSLGMAYAAFSRYLGHGAGGAEDYAANFGGCGETRYRDRIREAIRPHRDGTYELDPSFFDFSDSESPSVSRRFIEEFGPPRSPDGSPHFHATEDDPPSGDPEARRFADVAASVRSVVADEVLRLAVKARELTSRGNLCFGGQLALDCECNANLIESGPFRQVFVPVDPANAGGAVGAALYASLLRDPQRLARGRPVGPYMGGELDVEIALDAARGRIDEGLLSVRSFASDAGFLEHCARLLRDRKIVGWAQGRSETGPRALGNRSILIRPDDAALARRLSRSVKDGAPPPAFACSVAREEAEIAFGAAPLSSNAYRWMQASVPIAPGARESLRAAVRAGGKTCPQICSAADNALFHGLLREYGKISGLSALLNAPLSAGGFPIVDSALDALALFLRMDMDVLVLGTHVLEKPVGTP